MTTIFVIRDRLTGDAVNTKLRLEEARKCLTDRTYISIESNDAPTIR